MNNPNIMPAVIEHYDAVADQFAVIADSDFFNEYCERPAMFSLLGDVAGKRVLDAGCGAGRYSAWLFEQGAEVTAIDASERMVQLARQRLGDRAAVFVADFSQPLDMFASETFDVVVSPLALDYLPDWSTVFGEFNRVLRSNGRFIFSVAHPFFVGMKDGLETDYFAVRLVAERWSKYETTVPSYRRSLSTMTLALSNADFLLEKIVEPKPVESCQAQFPEEYERYSKYPVFICFSAVALPAVILSKAKNLSDVE